MSPEATVAVVGSINADATYTLEALPLPGETALSSSRHDAPGGKGANQAVALAALGVSVDMVGAVGDDLAGRSLVNHLQAKGVGCGSISISEKLPTGSAVILVSSSGENSIVVDAGANNALTSDQVETYFSQHSPAIVIAQLEVPLGVVLGAARLASGTFVLNPAPMPPSSAELSELIQTCDILVPNRTELASLAGSAIPQNIDEVVGSARKLNFNGQLVVTLGSDGAVVFPEGVHGDAIEVAAPRVESVDASGAGDAFCAALVSGLLHDMDLVRACEYACDFASWTTTQKGAQVDTVAPEKLLV